MMSALCSLTSIAKEDVDTRIAVNDVLNDKLFVIIIANEHYKYEQDVPFAINDGETFKLYCEKTLGIPNKNIRYKTDATLNDMRIQFRWLEKVMTAYEGEAKAIVYYSGHGMPDESTKQAYLLPIDGNSTISESGLSTAKLYQQLGSMPSSATLFILDACFSGAQRDGKMLSASRGVAIRTKNDVISGNMVVFSAAQGNETAYPYQEKRHGLFTYYLLEQLQESGGSIKLGALSDYVTKNVNRKSLVENDKSQTPTIVSSQVANNWRNWSLVDKKANRYEVIKREEPSVMGRNNDITMPANPPQNNPPKDESPNINKEKANSAESEYQDPFGGFFGGKEKKTKESHLVKQNMASEGTEDIDAQKAVLDNFASQICELYDVDFSKTSMSEIGSRFGVKQKKGNKHYEIHLKDGTEFIDCFDNGKCTQICIDPKEIKKAFPAIDNMSWKSSYREWNEWFVSKGFDSKPYEPYFQKQAMLVYAKKGISLILMFDGKESAHGSWFSLIITKEKE